MNVNKMVGDWGQILKIAENGYHIAECTQLPRDQHGNCQ